MLRYITHDIHGTVSSKIDKISLQYNTIQNNNYNTPQYEA